MNSRFPNDTYIWDEYRNQRGYVLACTDCWVVYESDNCDEWAVPIDDCVAFDQYVEDK